MLTRSPLRYAATDEALFRVIRRGLPDSGMPGTALSEREIRLLMQHVRGLARTAPASVRGNAAAGERLYAGKGNCAGCHMRNGSGATLAPDLTGIGYRRSQQHLRQSLTDPGAHLPDGFTMLRLTLGDGKTLTGARINEDTFSVQVRDGAGRTHSYWKTELKDVKRLAGESPMPSYRGVFSDAELDDVTAYLAQPEAAR